MVNLRCIRLYAIVLVVTLSFAQLILAESLYLDSDNPFPYGGEDAGASFVPGFGVFLFGGEHAPADASHDNDIYLWTNTTNVTYQGKLPSKYLSGSSVYYPESVTINGVNHPNGVVYMCSVAYQNDTNFSGSPNNGSGFWYDPWTNESGYTETNFSTAEIDPADGCFGVDGLRECYNTYDKCIYTMGGYWQDNGPDVVDRAYTAKKVICKFDPQNKSFDVVGNITSVMGRVPTCYVPEQNCVYGFGGQLNAVTCYDYIHRYNCTNTTYTLLEATCPEKFETPGVFYNPRNQLIYISGGYNCTGGGEYYNEVWTFNPFTKEISRDVVTMSGAIDDFVSVWDSDNYVGELVYVRSSGSGNDDTDQKYVEILDGDWEHNRNPVISGVYPGNHSEEIPISDTSLYVNFTDADGDNVTINVSISNGQTFEVNRTDGNWSFPLNELERNTIYNWWVNMSDGTNTTVNSYTFDSETNDPPWIKAVTPANNSVNVSFLGLSLYVNVSDNDTELMTINITLSDGQNITLTNKADGNYSFALDNLVYNETYTWWVNVSDGDDTTSRQYTFDTEDTYINSLCIGFHSDYNDLSGTAGTMFAIAGTMIIISVMLGIAVYISKYGGY